MATLELNKEDSNIELEIFKSINDITARKRCFIAELTKKSLEKYFSDENITINSDYSIYKLPLVNEELEVIDFEINSLSVHIIPTIDRDKNINVYIPRIYKLYNCKPDIVIFVNFSKNLSKMDIVGYLKDIDLNIQNIPKTKLESAENLINSIKNIKPSKSYNNTDITSTTNELMLAFIEKGLSDEGKIFFIKQLLLNKHARKNYKLFYAMNSNFIAIADNLQKENTINSIENNNADVLDVNNIQDDYAIIENTIENNENSTDELNNYLDEAFEENSYETTENNLINDINSEEEKNIETLPALNIADNNVQDIETSTGEDELISVNDMNLDDNSSNIELDNYDLDDSSIQLDNYDLQDTSFNELENNEESIDEEFTLNNDENFDLTETDDAETISDDEKLSANDILTTHNDIQDGNDMPTFSIKKKQTIDASNNSQPATENVQEPLNENNTNNQEDVFDFLSEISEDVNKQENIQIDNINTQTQQFSPENQFEKSDITKEATSIESPAEQSIINDGNLQNSNNQFDTAFNSAIQAQSASQSESQPQTISSQSSPKKSGSKLLPVILLLALFTAGGFQLYQHKDTLFGAKSDIHELDDVNIPPPINTAAIDQTQGNTSATDTGVVAPPPTQAANTVTANSQQPAANNTVKSTEDLPSLPSAVEPPKPKHLNDAIATALSKDYSGVRISKVSWEISETLAGNPAVSRYLTIAGKSIKNSLSQDLTSATEPSLKDNVTVNVTYLKNGTVSKVQICNSSGSKQIDDIVVKSVKDTLNFVKMPSLNLNKPEYQAKLVVRL